MGFVEFSHVTYSVNKSHQRKLPYIVISENQQTGNNFGERFANAIRSAFERGFQHVITIGNDCPTLTAADISKAEKQLRKGNAILGPAKDGGVYLIGLTESLFNPDKFKNLSWQTSNVFLELSNYFAELKSKRIQLQLKGDIDDQEELYHFLSAENKSELAEAFKKILLGNSPKISDRDIDPVFISQFERSLGLRGPPLH